MKIWGDFLKKKSFTINLDFNKKKNMNLRKNIKIFMN